MPACSSIFPTQHHREFKLTALLLLLPFIFFGQSLTGLWTGALSNDSTTVRKDQLFEIVLTEYRGKVYGYSRSEFIVNDTLYYIVKRVKGTIEGDVCEVTDDDIIAYNFRGKLDKGIKVTSTFKRNGNDSAWYLAGTWKTNATKKYYSVTGKVDLGQEKDLTASKIFPHLEELKIADEVAFYKERNTGTPVARIARPQRVNTEYNFSTDPAPGLAVTAPDLQRADADPVIPGLQKTGNSLSRTETKELGAGNTSIAVAAPDLQRADANPTIPDLKKTDNSLSRTDTRDLSGGKSTIPVTVPDLQRADPNPTIPDLKKADHNTARTEIKEPGLPAGGPKPAGKPVTVNKPATSPAANTNKPVVAASMVNEKKAGPPPANPAPGTNGAGKPAEPLAVNNTIRKQETNPPAALPPVVIVPKKSIDELTKKVAVIEGRKSEFSQVVDFKSDSLVLSLYDNGEIDGDTVSVIMNGETIMAKQGLKASAIHKTIYTRTGQDEDFTLVLFADNLGKYPPNTGLLVVHDGEDTYHLRFSSDFQKSTGIVFRRKK